MPMPTTATVTRTRSFGYQVRIGNRLFRLAQLAGADTRITTATPQPPRIDTAQNPEDIRSEAGVIFSLSDFKGGEGQAFIHRPNSTPDRFWASDGLDVAPPRPGEPASVRLLPTTASIRTNSGTNTFLAHDGAALYLSDDSSIYRSTNPLAAIPSFTTENPGGDPVALATLGSHVYVALGSDGIARRDGTWSAWSTLQATNLWAVKGRIIAASNQALYEAKAGAGSTLLHTLAAPHTWVGAIEAGEYILAAATDGTVYAFTLEEDTATLRLFSRTSVSPHAAITSISSHPSGLVFYGTCEPTSGGGCVGRFFRSGITAQGTLSFATLIRTWGDRTSTIHHHPTAITRYEESMVFGVDDSDEPSLAAVSHLWRYDLETTGRVRYFAAPSSGPVVSLLPHAGRLFFTHNGPVTATLQRSSNTAFVSSGYLISPLADHFTAQVKNWAEVLVDIQQLNGGIIEIWYSPEQAAIHNPLHPSWRLARRITRDDQTDGRAISEVSRYLAIKIVLLATQDASASPFLLSFSTRSFSGPSDLILDLPINVSDELNIPFLRRLRAPRLGHRVYDTLRGIEGTNQEVSLFSPPETLYGYVEQVETPIPALTVQGSRTLVSMVRVRARRTGSISSSSTDSGLGLEPLGIAPMGGTA
jgi:hypothetical protein